MKLRTLFCAALIAAVALPAAAQPLLFRASQPGLAMVFASRRRPPLLQLEKMRREFYGTRSERTARLIEQMEDDGVIGPADGIKGRPVLDME